ncbi:MAG: HNH endonuclease, partial [Terracoccus sp.]
MFESGSELTTEGLQALVAALSRLDERVDDAGRIDQLSALERVKSAVAAAQARVTVGFIASQEQIAAGWREHAKACADDNDFDGWRQARDNARRASLEEPEPADQNPGDGGRSRKRPVLANGIAAQVALARHESPHRGSQHLTLALTLDRHLPTVLAWLQAGVLSEWRATLIVREAAVLTPDRQQVL